MEDGLARLDAEMDEYRLRRLLKRLRYEYTSERTALAIHQAGRERGYLQRPEHQELRRTSLRVLKTAEAAIDEVEDIMRSRGMKIPNPGWHKREVRMSATGEFLWSEEGEG